MPSSIVDRLIFALLPLMTFNTFEAAQGIAVQIIPALILISSLPRWMASVLSSTSRLHVPPICYPVFYLVVIKLFTVGLWPSAGGVFLLVKLAVAAMEISYFASLGIRFQSLMRTYYASLYVSVAYAAYQYLIGLLNWDRAQSYANLPIYLWNSAAWHHLIVRDGVVRTQGFAFEPPYLAIFLAVGILGWLSHAGSRNRFGLWVLVFGLLLSYSRNGIVFAVFLVSFLLAERNLSVRTFRCLPLFSFIFPVLISVVLFGNSEYDGDDVSVIARMLPLQIYFSDSLHNVHHFLVGVENYTAFITANWPSELNQVLLSEHVDSDSMSLVGFMVYNFGLVGTLGYVAISSYIVRNSKKGLLIISSFFLVAFNIGSIFWPVAGLVSVLSYGASGGGKIELSVMRRHGRNAQGRKLQRV